MGKYMVIGAWRYREHEPGEIFFANLDPEVERRAVTAGAIRVLEPTVVKIDLNRCTPPRGW